MKPEKLILHRNTIHTIINIIFPPSRQVFYLLRLFCFLCIMLIYSSCVAFANDGFIDAMKTLSAESFVIFEARTGKLLYEKNGHKRFFFSEPINMATAASISSLAASDHESAEVKLDRYQTSEFAVAILQTVESDTAASLEGKASEGISNLNLQDTRLTANGIFYASAYDLGKIAAVGFKYPSLRRMLEKDTCDVSPTRLGGECYFAFGTERSSQIKYIAVVMNTDTGYAKKETKKILDWAPMLNQASIEHKKQDFVKPIRIYGGMVNEITTRPQKNIVFPVTKTIPGVFPFYPRGDWEDKKYTLQIELYDPIEAPVTEGQKVGIVHLFYDGEEFDQIDMVADQSVEKFSLIQWIKGWFTLLYQNITNLFI